MQRVISGDDMYGDGLGSTERIVNPGAGETDAMGTPPPNVETSPALVENDQEMDIDADDADTHFASASEISEMSDGLSFHESEDRGGDYQMMEYLASQPMQMFQMNTSNVIPEQAVANFPRNDSKVSSDSSSTSMRGSSQNSSRDWGWFEDVHLSEHAISPHLKRKDTSDDKNNKKKGKKGGKPVNYGNPDDMIHNHLDKGKLTASLGPRCRICFFVGWIVGARWEFVLISVRAASLRFRIVYVMTSQGSDSMGSSRPFVMFMGCHRFSTF
jgi:hypothetical protein